MNISTITAAWRGQARRRGTNLLLCAAGSYAPTADLTMRAGQLQPAALTSCGTSSGLTHLNIVPANPSSLFSHGIW